MALLLILAVTIALYARTVNYYYLIDDIVRRWGYLLEIPETSPPPQFYSTKPPKTKHLFLTLTHCLIVSQVYFLWGWKAALLFAVNPIAVACTAWITGGYYQVTTFLTLTSYYFLVNLPGILGASVAAIFFTAALGSTINCIAFPFIFLFVGPLGGLMLFWPLGMYLTGRRFKIGFKKRNLGKGDPLTWRKVALVPKVLAYYIKMTVWPKRLAFFQTLGFEYGKDPAVKIDLESFNKEFWQSIVICLGFTAIGLLVSPVGLLIYMAGILPFTQWKVLGQFVTERYMYLPLVGWSLMLAGILAHPLLTPVLFTIVGLYAWRAHKYIPAFKNIETLYENGIKNFPECISNYVNLAERYLHLGKLFDAYKLLKKGIDMDPDSFLCHANMAAYWLAINRPEHAQYHTKLAMKYAESRGMAYNIFKQQLNHIMQGLAGKAEQEKKVALIEEKIKRERMEKTNVVNQAGEIAGGQLCGMA